MNTTPPQPHQNDRDELARLLPPPAERDLPNDRQRRVQEFVMSRIQQDLGAKAQAPRRRTRRRFALAGSALAAAAAVAVAVVVGANGFGGSGPVGDDSTDGSSVEGLAPLARTFELAASHAAAEPYTPPRPDQWLYIENKELVASEMGKSKGQPPEMTIRTWISVDGTKTADHNHETGEVKTWPLENDYPALSALPTDPRELLALLRDRLQNPQEASEGADDDPAPPIAEGPRTEEDWDAAVFQRISQILNANLLPPDVTAALWRAAALIPGVTENSETLEIDGRTVTAVGMVQDGWRLEQLLLDPETHEFVGYRSVAVEDHTYAPGGETITEKQGQLQFETIRLAAKFVDAAGETG